MKIIYVDIDTLRPDHLGCYGYHRNTSPNIDSVAGDGVRFNNVYVPDAPCLPSRSALHHGRFGIHNGAINHGGMYADPFAEGPTREFHTSGDYTHWVTKIQNSGYYTCTVSSFAKRHDAWWFLAGFNEVHDCGKCGGERADEVIDQGLECLENLKDKENFFFHFNIWDPHTPYRTPDEYGNPFKDVPPPAWMTQDIIDQQQQTYGTHSANAVQHNPFRDPTSREVSQVKNLDDYTKWVDGYDVGIRYADDAVGQIIAKLKEYGIYEETAIIISSDHGENQGELNIYGDHQTADTITCKVPMIVKWPGMESGVDSALHYQFDVAATVLELIGAQVPAKWDAVSFKDAFTAQKEEGRDYLVISQACWSCQRGVVFGDYLLIKTYDDGLKDFPEIMLFNLKEDPHETDNLADSMPEKVNEGLALLQKWVDAQMANADYKFDPMLKVIEEGGPFHTRGRLDEYLKYYESIDRPEIAAKMQQKYGA